MVPLLSVEFDSLVFSILSKLQHGVKSISKTTQWGRTFDPKI
jgi:hypothetical protein